MGLIICILIVVIIFLWFKNNKTTQDFRDKTNIFVEKINNQQNEIAELTNKLSEINRELEFYKNIEEDSGKLNAEIRSEEDSQLLEQATEQIKNARTQKTLSELNFFPKRNKTVLDNEQLLACNEMEFSNKNFSLREKQAREKAFC